MQDRVAPKTQTREEIKAEIAHEENQVLVGAAARLALQMFTDYDDPRKAIHVVVQALGVLLGNAVEPNEVTLKAILARTFADIELTTRNTLTVKTNAERALGKS